MVASHLKQFFAKDGKAQHCEPNSHSIQAVHFRTQMEVTAYNERLRLVRSWNRLSGNGQGGIGPNEFIKIGMSDRAASVDLFTL